MKERAIWWKTHWSDLAFLVLLIPFWVFTLYDVAIRLRTMSLIQGLDEGMALFIVPVMIWKTINKLRRQPS